MNGYSINVQAFESMMNTFDQRGHRPSDEQKAGLRSIQETLTLMLIGKAESSYYLSSLDPGVGKSTAIIEWINSYLLHREMYGSHGILICFDRLEEIKRFVDGCNLSNDCYAVKVSESHDGRELNDRGLGSKNINNALVLFTTKQQIALRSKGKDFKDTQIFHYHGVPRRVRIWDESLVVGKELRLDRFELLSLINEISKIDSNAAFKIDDIACQLRSCKNKDVYYMPDMGMTLNDMMMYASQLPKPEADIAETLGVLLGRDVTVRTNERRHVAVDCEKYIPNDFAPCLVTDASGRIRKTYGLQHEYRGDLKRLLPEATKEYSNLTISVWSKASGKSAYKAFGHKMYADEIIMVINARYDEKFLVVRHLKHKELEEEVLKSVINPDRVKFIHWGIHTATNEYASIPNVVISSPLTYRFAAYEALARASATLKTADGVITDEQLKNLKCGEYAHHLLQAICRGAVRKSDGAGCPESRVWIIAAPHTMIEKNLCSIFPYCKVERWNTSPEALKGSQQRVYEYILEKIEGCDNEGTVRVPSLSVRKYLGVPQSNFKRDVIKNDALNKALALHRINVEQNGNKYYFVRDTFDYGVTSSAS